MDHGCLPVWHAGQLPLCGSQQRLDPQKLRTEAVCFGIERLRFAPRASSVFRNVGFAAQSSMTLVTRET